MIKDLGRLPINKALRKRLQRQRKNNQCLNGDDELEGMGKSWKKKFKKISKAVKKVPGAKLASKAISTQVKLAKKGLSTSLKVVNKVSAIPVIGQAARIGAGVATGGASEAAISAAKIAQQASTGKMTLKKFGKLAVKGAATYATSGAAGGKIGQAGKMLKTAQKIKKVASFGKKLISSKGSGGEEIVTEVPSSYTPQEGEQVVESFDPSEASYVKTSVHEQGELVGEETSQADIDSLGNEGTESKGKTGLIVAGGAAALIGALAFLKGRD